MAIGADILPMDTDALTLVDHPVGVAELPSASSAGIGGTHSQDVAVPANASQDDGNGPAPQVILDVFTAGDVSFPLEVLRAMLTHLLGPPAVVNADHNLGHGSAPLQAIQDVSDPGAVHFLPMPKLTLTYFADTPVVIDADHAHGRGPAGPQAIGEFADTALFLF